MTGKPPDKLTFKRKRRPAMLPTERGIEMIPTQLFPAEEFILESEEGIKLEVKEIEFEQIEEEKPETLQIGEQEETIPVMLLEKAITVLSENTDLIKTPVKHSDKLYGETIRKFEARRQQPLVMIKEKKIKYTEIMDKKFKTNLTEKMTNNLNLSRYQYIVINLDRVFRLKDPNLEDNYFYIIFFMMLHDFEIKFILITNESKETTEKYLKKIFIWEFFKDNPEETIRYTENKNPIIPKNPILARSIILDSIKKKASGSLLYIDSNLIQGRLLAVEHHIHILIVPSQRGLTEEIWSEFINNGLEECRWNNLWDVPEPIKLKLLVPCVITRIPRIFGLIQGVKPESPISLVKFDRKIPQSVIQGIRAARGKQLESEDSYKINIQNQLSKMNLYKEYSLDHNNISEYI